MREFIAYPLEFRDLIGRSFNEFVKSTQEGFKRLLEQFGLIEKSRIKKKDLEIAVAVGAAGAAGLVIGLLLGLEKIKK